jgi:hypothetical protein
MATMTNCTCVQAALTSRERVRYFTRQLLTADDMRAEQEYFREKQRRHNRLLHGWGVVCGMEVIEPQTGEPDWQVTVNPGVVLTPQGDEIVCSDKVTFDVKTGLQQPEPCVVRWPCPPAAAPAGAPVSTKVYLVIRYVECSSRPVRVQVAGCACDESACEYSRVRDSFELDLLTTLPASHQQMKDFYKTWCATWKKKKETFPLPVPPCPACSDDPWVVLATITIPTMAAPRIGHSMIVYSDRMPLYSSTILQVLQTCSSK